MHWALRRREQPSKKFLQRIDPRLAIRTADYDNKHDHPRDEIRELLHEQSIRLMTTKTGDVLVRSIGNHTGNYEAINCIARSPEEPSKVAFRARGSVARQNDDAVRERYVPRHRVRQSTLSWHWPTVLATSRLATQS